jgi:DNA-binding NarL/FixJ family response regulator
VLTCVVIDDSPRFLASARRLLESQGLRVLGCASSSAEALAMTESLAPDVALVDVELGSEDGIELAHEIAGRPGATRVILISAHEREEVARLMEGRGPLSFLPKTALGAAAIAELAG